MKPPDQRLFEEDIESPGFLGGVLKGRWAMAEAGVLPEKLAWPDVILWIAAAPRSGAPDRYYFALNLSGYRNVPPTGPVWDPVKKETLELAKWPKGKPGSRFALVFRTNRFSFAGRALYHPYDRSPLSDHPRWPTEQPHLIWDSNHTILDYVEEFHSLLHSGDYIGV